jgi:hypothetical protein
MPRVRPAWIATAAVAAAVMFSAPVTAQTSPPTSVDVVVESFHLRDAGDLVTACSVNKESELYARANAFCLGYMSGAMQFYSAAVASPDVTPFICAGRDISRAEMRTIFLDWAKNHPDRLGEPPIDGLVRAAVAQFPCKR